MHMGRGGLSHAQGPSVKVLRRTVGVCAAGRLTPGTPRGCNPGARAFCDGAAAAAAAWARCGRLCYRPALTPGACARAAGGRPRREGVL